MPEGLRLVVLAVVICSHLRAGLPVTGITADQIRFEGELIAVDEALLHISRQTAGEALVRGLPIDGVRSIRPVDLPNPAEFLDQMEPLLPLVLRWDRDLLPICTEALYLLAGQENWSELHHRTLVLLQHSLPTILREEVLLMQAWALVELHLISRARQVLETARTGADPLELPWRHCWILARIHLGEGRIMEARRWASLPLLRIPSATGPAARELQDLLQSMTGSESS